MSKGYVGGIDLKSTLLDKDEGVWSHLMKSRHVVKFRSYLRQRARNDYILCCLPKKNKWRKRIKTLVHSRYMHVFTTCTVFPQIKTQASTCIS